MKEKILKDFKEKFNWLFDGSIVYFDILGVKHRLNVKLTRDEFIDFISQALDEYGAEKYEKGYLDGKNNQPKGLNK